jgi:hypothetical protein
VSPSEVQHGTARPQAMPLSRQSDRIPAQGA